MRDMARVPLLEVAHYIGKYGIARVAKAVLVSSVPPLRLSVFAAAPSGFVPKCRTCRFPQ